MIANSSPPIRQTVSLVRTIGEEDRGDLGEDVVAGRVAVHVVDALEVVEVEHDERDGRLVGRGDEELLPEPLVERAVVPEPGEWVGLRLVLERGANVRVSIASAAASANRTTSRNSSSVNSW